MSPLSYEAAADVLLYKLLLPPLYSRYVTVTSSHDYVSQLEHD